MVLFNHSTRELTAKIVYYGPGLCGKTTNLRSLYEKLDRATTGRLLSLATAQDRTIYFDLLPVELGNVKGYTVRFQLCTVPGQVFYNETRKLVLRGVDGIVFVVDSQWSMLSHDLDSFQNLKDNLLEAGLTLDELPVVIQFNKRDLPGVLSVQALQESLGFGAYPFVEGVASEGRGVLETFKLVSKLTFVSLLKRLQRSPGIDAERLGPEWTAPSGVDLGLTAKVPGASSEFLSLASAVHVRAPAAGQPPPPRSFPVPAPPPRPVVVPAPPPTVESPFDTADPFEPAPGADEVFAVEPAPASPPVDEVFAVEPPRVAASVADPTQEVTVPLSLGMTRPFAVRDAPAPAPLPEAEPVPQVVPALEPAPGPEPEPPGPPPAEPVAEPLPEPPVGEAAPEAASEARSEPPAAEVAAEAVAQAREETSPAPAAPEPQPEPEPVAAAPLELSVAASEPEAPVPPAWEGAVAGLAGRLDLLEARPAGIEAGRLEQAEAASLAAVASLRQELAERIAPLEDAGESSRAALASLREELSARITPLEESAEAVRAAVAALRDELGGRIDRLADELRSLAAASNETVAGLAAVGQELAAGGAARGELASRMESLAATVASEPSRLEALVDEARRAAEEKAGSLERAVAEAVRGTGDAEARRSAAEGELREAIAGAVAAARNGADEASARAAALEAEVRGLRDGITDQVAASEEILRGLLADAEARAAERSRLEEQLQADLAAVRRELDDSRSRAAEERRLLEERLAASDGRMRGLSAALSALGRVLQDFDAGK